MAVLHQSAATLRFFGDDLDPDEVTRLLGKLPSRAARKGDARRSKTGQDYAPRKTGSWLLEVPDTEPADLDKQIQQLLSEVTADPGVWAELSGYKPNVVFGLFTRSGNEMCALSPETLKALADRGIELVFDVYGPGEEEQSNAG